MLNSQVIRKSGPEVDPLWLGAGRSVADLSKPQILIDSTYGDSHPGSRHLNTLAESARNAVYAAQAMPALYTVTDICDGVATGHAGMNYSLVSRDLIAGMVEIHARASAFDGLVTISSCDKAVPGHLMALARLDLPGLHVSGGSMAPGPRFISADTCYETNLRVAEGNMTAEEEWYYKRNACMSCGACQYMGTASTMQAMAEALGMSLPGNAMIPANTSLITHLAADAGAQAAELIRRDLRPSAILTRAAFETAIAAEVGIQLTLQDFETLTAGIPLLAKTLTAGRWPTQYFWYAGGVPAVMRELRDQLDLSVMTVTGHTLGENLEELERTGYFRRSEEMMEGYGLTPRDIIHSAADPVDSDSGVTILRGNLAPEGAVIKHCAVDKSMHHFIGRARVFDNEESAVAAIYEDRIQPGDVVVIRYVGRRAAGMPEMLKATDAICNKPALCRSTALVTDGRFSGATRGPSVGYLLPEAAAGGPIAYVEDGDVIEIDVAGKRIGVIGIHGEKRSQAEVEREFKERKSSTQLKTFERKGVLKFLDV